MNRGSDSILSVYSDARAEYTKQLCVFLVPAYFQFFTELLEKSKQTMANEPKKALWQFQNYLNEIHDWNMNKVNNEIHTILVNSGCDYLEDLLTAVFIAHTKVLTAIRLSSNNKKVEINIPKVEHFLFKVLCETSKLLWSSTYLFRDGISGIEKQQNYRNIEQLINEGILQAVRSLVPVKTILRDFVNNDVGGNVNEDDEDDSDDEEQKEVKPVVQEIAIPQPVTLSEPVTPVETNTISPDVPIQSESVNTVTEEIKTDNSNEVTNIVNQVIENTNPVIANPPTIIIEDRPTVRFGEFNALFDTEHPNESDMVYDSKEDEVPDLEILDEDGAPLSEGIDFDSLDENDDGPEAVDDYEDLN
jgi:hypothetical protein